MGAASPSLASSSELHRRFSSFIQVIKWTQTEQLHNQMKNFTAVSSGNILISVLFRCPLLSNCGNLWTLFHHLPVSAHSRRVSIYIAVWWWQWPDRPKRLSPLPKPVSLQRCQKHSNRKNAHLDNGRSAILLHFANWWLPVFAVQTTGRRMPVVYKGLLRKHQGTLHCGWFCCYCSQQLDRCIEIDLKDLLAS